MSPPRSTGCRLRHQATLRATANVFAGQRKGATVQQRVPLPALGQPAASRPHLPRDWQQRYCLDTRNQFALPVKDNLLKPIHPHWHSILNS